MEEGEGQNLYVEESKVKESNLEDLMKDLKSKS